MDISDGIDIASFSTDFATNKILSDVGVAMLDNTLELQETMGNELTKMMEMSVNPSIGGNIDAFV